jgi:hypothetical protein
MIGPRWLLALASATGAAAGVGVAATHRPTTAGRPCHRTLHPSQDGSIGLALRRAPGGSVVCLTSGTYGAAQGVIIAGVDQGRRVTLAPAPAARVRLTMLTLTGRNRGITIRGFTLGRVSVTGTATDLTFTRNTIDHATSGFYFSAGEGEAQSGIRVTYNRMSHLVAPSIGGVASAQCVTIAGGAVEEHGFVVSHNTCGPDIGSHYFQVGGIDHLIADDNTFLGPPDPEVFSQDAHNNVLQVFGDASDVEFSHNVIRGTESRGQTVLIEEGHFKTLRINDNLWQEAPTCLTDVSCHSYAIEVYNAQGLEFNYNTVIDSYWGVILTATEPQSYAAGYGYVITHNLVVGTRDNRDISYLGCARSCLFDYNVTSDRSARQGGSRHQVTRWHPHFVNKIWFEPVGLQFPAGFRR